MAMKKIWGLMLILALCAGGLFFALQVVRTPEPVQKMTRFLMDTYCTIQVPGDTTVREPMARAFDRLAEIDGKFNALNTNSPIYKFNHANLPITDPEIVGLIRKALAGSAQSPQRSTNQRNLAAHQLEKTGRRKR